jgi:Arc/MetJ-type ribon-helix-helix transcriptional regulator
MNTHFPIPQTKTKTIKRKVESNKYFEADEVYKQKLQKTAEKKQKGTRKRERKN